MNHLTYFASATRPAETCVVGSGGFGRSFLAQARRIPLVNARVAVDREAAIAVAALHSIGIAMAASRSTATRALTSGMRRA